MKADVILDGCFMDIPEKKKELSKMAHKPVYGFSLNYKQNAGLSREIPGGSLMGLRALSMPTGKNL